eukprot:gene4252-5797_t
MLGGRMQIRPFDCDQACGDVDETYEVQIAALPSHRRACGDRGRGGAAAARAAVDEGDLAVEGLADSRLGGDRGGAVEGGVHEASFRGRRAMSTELRSHLDAFIATAGLGSFSAAARQLGLTPAAVSKSVAQMELRLGVRLFLRSTRSLALTTDGERLYSQVRLPWAEIGEALTDLSRGAGKPSGTLKVALAHMVGREYFLPLLAAFVQRYPDVVPDLHFDNRQVDLVAEGFDV